MAIQSVAADKHLRSSQAMALGALTPFSVTTWMNCTWTPGSRRSFVGIYGPATDTPLGTPVTALQIGTTAGGGELSFWTWGGTVLCGTAAAFMNSYNGQWVQITYTYDGTNHRGYLNGTQVCTGVVAQQAGFLNQVYINGYPNAPTSEVADHLVDTYALYRYCLSPDEVMTIAKSGGARHGIVDKMICRYAFTEEAQGATVASVIDMSGNGHTLTTTGAGTNMIYTYTNVYATANLQMVQ